MPHRKSFVLDVKYIQARGGTLDVYVKLDKNADWVLKSVGGGGMVKGGLSRSTLMSELREKAAVAECVAISAVAECDAKSAVAERMDEKDTNDDPMSALDHVVTDTQPTHSTRSGGKRACKSKRGSDAVQTISMPLLPLGKCGGKTVKVRVFPTSTSTLWIHRDDVPWLVAYIADEVAFGGVEDTEYPDGETPQ